MWRSSKAKRLSGDRLPDFRCRWENLEAPTARLMAGVLADDAVEPPLEPAGELEIRPVDGQHERIVED
jgi:hypothetical protein